MRVAVNSVAVCGICWTINDCINGSELPTVLDDLTYIMLLISGNDGIMKLYGAVEPVFFT
jgi:hypothetical protein